MPPLAKTPSTTFREGCTTRSPPADRPAAAEPSMRCGRRSLTRHDRCRPGRRLRRFSPARRDFSDGPSAVILAFSRLTYPISVIPPNGDGPATPPDGNPI